MIKTAPHLPPETCRVDTHNRVRNTGLILLLFFLAFFSGLTGAIVYSAWLAPSFSPDYLIRTQNNFERNQSEAPDLAFVKQTRQKIISLYDKRKKIDSNYYSEEALVGETVAVSSDGWAVAELNSFSLGQEKNWEGLDSQGIFYKIEKAVYDSTSKLLFVKFNGDGFRIVSFADYKKVDYGTPVWVYKNGQWQANELNDYKLLNSKKTFAIGFWRFWRTLTIPAFAGGLIFDNQGYLLGFSTADNFVLPSSLVENQISYILSSQNVKYFGLNINGYLISKTIKNNNWVDLQGFYISEITSRKGVEKLLKGDVIIEINNELINQYNLPMQINSAPDQFDLIVLRQGKELSFTVTKNLVNL